MWPERPAAEQAALRGLWVGAEGPPDREAQDTRVLLKGETGPCPLTSVSQYQRPLFTFPGLV